MHICIIHYNHMGLRTMFLSNSFFAQTAVFSISDMDKICNEIEEKKWRTRKNGVDFDIKK